MSEIQVNKISPATGTAITLGDSGDTFTIPSGATLTNSGTATGFGGAALTNDFRMSLFYANNNQSISSNTGTTITGYWTNSNITGRLIVNPSNAAVTESSGIFTFAATGYYLVMGKLNGNLSGAGQYYFYVESTDNNSSYSDAIDSNTGVQSSGRNFVTQVSTVLKVEDTSNDKVRFTVYYEDNGGTVNGNGNRLRTSAQFIKIADI
jgi:hypothetical protein